MSKGLNRFTAIGNLGRDPETRHMPSGGRVTNFSVAVTESWKDKTTGEKAERTDWVNCECWGKLSEIAEQYLSKGSKVYIEGRLRIDSAEKDGITKYYTKIRLDSILFLSATRPQPQEGAPAQQTAPAQQEQFDDDIPF